MVEHHCTRACRRSVIIRGRCGCDRRLKLFFRLWALQGCLRRSDYGWEADIDMSFVFQVVLGRKRTIRFWLSRAMMTLDFSHRCCHQILITFTTKFWSGFDAVKGIDGTDGLRVGGMCFGGNAPTDCDAGGAFCCDYCKYCQLASGPKSCGDYR